MSAVRLSTLVLVVLSAASGIGCSATTPQDTLTPLARTSSLPPTDCEMSFEPTAPAETTSSFALPGTTIGKPNRVDRSGERLSAATP